MYGQGCPHESPSAREFLFYRDNPVSKPGSADDSSKPRIVAIPGRSDGGAKDRRGFKTGGSTQTNPQSEICPCQLASA
jgi:hypothetical protein